MLAEIVSGFFKSREEGTSPHIGVDLKAKIGTKVYSFGDGKVIASDYTDGTGQFIVIQYKNGDKVRFMHLSEKFVEVGQTVYEGQVFALSGNTGYQSPGKHYKPHLHVDGADKNGVMVNPLERQYGTVTNEVFFTVYGGDYLTLKAAKEAGTVAGTGQTAPAASTGTSISNGIKKFTIRRINLIDRSKDNTRLRTGYGFLTKAGMNIFNVLFGVLYLLNSSLSISKNGIGDVTFNKKVNEYNKKDYFKIERKFYTDEAGDSTYYVTLYLNKNHFISIEADPGNKKAISMTTNSPGYYTADSIRVGSTFEQLVSKYDGLLFLDGEGGELSAYLKKENILFQMPDLTFKDGFNYQNKKRKLEKSALLKNVKNKKVTVKYIKVVNYDIP